MLSRALFGHEYGNSDPSVARNYGVVSLQHALVLLLLYVTHCSTRSQGKQPVSSVRLNQAVTLAPFDKTEHRTLMLSRIEPQQPPPPLPAG